MKKLLFKFRVLTLLTLFFISGCSSINEYRIPVSQRENCLSVLEQFNLNLNNHQSVFSIQQGSLASSIENYEQKMSSIFNYIPTISGFISKYQRENGHLPKNKLIFNYLIDANKALVDRLSILRGSNDEINYVLNNIIEHLSYTDNQLQKIDNFLAEQQGFLNRRYNFRNFNDKNKLRQFKKEFYGPLGELDIYLKINDAQAQGIFFREMENATGKFLEHNQVLVRAVETKQAQFAQVSTEVYLNFESRFPTIFNRSGETIDDKVTKTFQWLRSKEIDIIAKINEQKYLIEVKNYSKTIDLDALLDDYGGSKKSIYTQQQELVEIIEFLELPYRPMAIFRRGISEEASQKLEALGIKVIGN